jgi:glutathione S-transferase
MMRSMPEIEFSPILYSFRRCPYAMRARMALWSARIPVELREVVLQNKPGELLAVSAKGTVPVLVLPDGQVIDESFDIMKWALTCNDPDGWLDIDLTAANALVDRNDNDFKPNLDRYKYPQRFVQDSAEETRTAGLQYLNMLNDLLCERPFLLSERISLVDVAVAPFVRQFAHHNMAWFDSSVGRRLNDWLAYFEASVLFQSVMQKYPPWSPSESVIILAAR